MKAMLCAIAAGLCWGIGELCTKSVLHSGKVGLMTVMLVRALCALPLALCAYAIAYHALRAEPAQWWRADTPTLVKLVAGTGVLAGFGGVLFFYLGLTFGEISRVKPVAFALAPLVAVVLGWLILGETMTVRKAVAVALMLSGVVLLTGK